MIKKVLPILLLPILVLVVGCTTTMPLTFETLHPAQTAIPLDADSALFINRLTPQSCRVASSVTTLDNNCKGYKIVSDSLRYYLPAALYTLLDDNVYFPSITYQEVDELPSEPKPLIVTFDAFSINNHYTEKLVIESFYYTRNKVEIQALLSLITPNDTAPQTVFYRDSLSWEASGYTLESAKEQLPTMEEVITVAAMHTAESLVDKFTPYYIKGDRVLYIVPAIAAMREGYNYWLENKLQEASYMWEYAYEHGISKKQRAMAAHNVALCYELQDNLQGAIEWLEKSQQLLGERKSTRQHRKLAEKYIQQLNVRIGEDKQVMEQLY